MATAETARLIASLELRDQFSKTVNNALTGITRLDRRIDQSKSKFFQVGQHVGIGMQNTAKAALGLLAAGGTVVTASLKLAGDFEGQLNTINTIARKTPTELGAIGDSIRKVARETGTGLSDLTQGYYDLLSAGVKVTDATQVLTAANMLAIGGLSTTAESVDLLTTALNVYGGGATAATKYADVFAKTIERGKVTAADLAASFSQVGSIAKSSGIDINELGAAYARLTAGGTDAAEASTQIRSAIVALTKVNAPLEKLQKQTGRNYLAIAGKQGLVAALEIMRKDAAKAGVPLVDLLGRVEGLNFTLATTGPNFAAYNADLAAMGQATGTAAAQMAERQKGLNYQLTILKTLAKDAGITIGSALLPRLTPLVKRLNEFVNLNQDKIKEFGDKIAGLFSDENIAQGIDAMKGAFNVAREAAPAIADAARITGSALKIAVDLFKSLPKELQGLAIAGLAVNKLTGGLVTNLAGGLISAVLKQLVSGVVNVNGAVVNVVGGGGVPGVPAPTGGLGLISKVFLVGEAIGLGALVLATQQSISRENSAQATGITDSVAKQITGGASLAELQQSLAAVDKGIADIANTPLGVLVQGDALDQLKRTHFDLKAAIQAQTDAIALAGRDTVGGIENLPTAAQSEMNAKRIEAAENRTGTIMDSTGRIIGKQASASLLAFRAATNALRNAKGSDVGAAIKSALASIFVKGQGGSGGAANVLAALKSQLKNTHDPKLAADLRSAIGKVERKLAARQIVEAQLRKADQILKSNLSTAQKVEALKGVQRAIGNRNAIATQRVADKIAEAKRAQVAATNRLRATIAGKAFGTSITNIIKTVVDVNSRSVVASQTTYRKYFSTAS